MAKFGEKELTENLKDFESNTQIELEFEKNIDGKIVLENATIKYDEKYGFINIISNSGSFKINTTLVFGYERIEDEIIINLDTLILKIRKV